MEKPGFCWDSLGFSLGITAQSGDRQTTRQHQQCPRYSQQIKGFVIGSLERLGWVSREPLIEVGGGSNGAGLGIKPKHRRLACSAVEGEGIDTVVYGAGWRGH